MNGQILMENNSTYNKELKSKTIKESKKYKGYCEENGRRLLNVIYFLDKINYELKMINHLNNPENRNNGIIKIESFYLIIVESLFIASDCINNCRLIDFDNENYLKACKFLDDSILSEMQKLIVINRKYFNNIINDVNKYRLIYNSKLKGSTSMDKVISKYSFA